MRNGDFFMLSISDSLTYPGKSYRDRDAYRRDLHWFISQKFPGYADCKFRSSSEAAVLARKIQNYFNVIFDIVPVVDVD